MKLWIFSFTACLLIVGIQAHRNKHKNNEVEELREENKRLREEVRQLRKGCHCGGHEDHHDHHHDHHTHGHGHHDSNHHHELPDHHHYHHNEIFIPGSALVRIPDGDYGNYSEYVKNCMAPHMSANDAVNKNWSRYVLCKTSSGAYCDPNTFAFTNTPFTIEIKITVTTFEIYGGGKHQMSFPNLSTIGNINSFMICGGYTNKATYLNVSGVTIR